MSKPANKSAKQMPKESLESISYEFVSPSFKAAAKVFPVPSLSI
jgi:hypothetical protein